MSKWPRWWWSEDHLWFCIRSEDYMISIAREDMARMLPDITGPLNTPITTPRVALGPHPSQTPTFDRLLQQDATVDDINRAMDDVGKTIAAEPEDADWPPRQSALNYQDSVCRCGSTGQLWVVSKGQWVRVRNTSAESAP